MNSKLPADQLIYTNHGQNLIEPRQEKTCLQGLQEVKTHSGLLS